MDSGKGFPPFLSVIFYIFCGYCFIFIYVRRTHKKEIITNLLKKCRQPCRFCASCDVRNLQYFHEALSKVKVFQSHLSLNVIPIHSTCTKAKHIKTWHTHLSLKLTAIMKTT